MKKRREVVEITMLIFTFLKNNSHGEFSINQIAKKVETRWNTTKKVLELLKFLGLLKERMSGGRKNATRYYSLKIA